LRTRLTFGGCEYLAMVPLSVKYTNLHTDINNSKKTATEPNLGVAGNWLTQTWIMHDATQREHRYSIFYVRGSVHHGIIHKENPTICNSVSRFYFIFIWSSTCFGRHTAHHQEPKTALAASGFADMDGCWTCSCWTLSAKHVELHINMK
jgi:hypothetical protein